MSIIILCVSILIIILTLLYVNYIATKRKILKLTELVLLLERDLLIYKARALQLEPRGLSYESVFRVYFADVDYAPVTSQKKLMARMMFLIKVTDDYINSLNPFEDLIELQILKFNELKKEIRTEKLFKEGTVF